MSGLTRAVLALGLGVAAVTVGLRVAAGQENQPGMPTTARMFILNRTKAEAVPVTLQGGEVQPVTIVGVPSIDLAPAASVSSRAARQPWDYRQIAIRAGEDAAGALTSAGSEGWEAIGTMPGAAGFQIVLLKRPR